MLIIKGLMKKFDDNIVFEHLNVKFDVPRQIYSVIGESGCGKTTLLNILFGKNSTEITEPD